MKRKGRTRLSKKEVRVLDDALDNIVTNLPIETANIILGNKKNIQKACEVAKERFEDMPVMIESSTEMKKLIERLRQQGGGFVGM